MILGLACDLAFNYVTTPPHLSSPAGLPDVLPDDLTDGNDFFGSVA